MLFRVNLGWLSLGQVDFDWLELDWVMLYVLAPLGLPRYLLSLLGPDKYGACDASILYCN